MFKGLDILKFVCALLVVYIHTYCYEPGWGWIKEVLSSLGVPFFFITSGFFFSKGLKKNIDASSYLLRYIKRVSLMYLMWTLLSLPVAWMNISFAHTDYSCGMKCLYLVRCLFLTGSLGIYWYVLSLVYNCIIIYHAKTKKCVCVLYTFAILFFGIGVAYDAGFLRETLIYDLIHVGVGSTRNFLNVGLLYMCIGHFIADHKLNGLFGNKYFWLVLLFLVLVYRFLSKDYVTSLVFQIPASLFLFLFGLCWNPLISDTNSLLLRKWSTIIYLTHFPFILVFDYYLKRGTLVDYFFTVLFCFCFYFLLKIILPERFLKTLYG